MKVKTLVPIVGIHSSGKSTIRMQLEDMGFITEEECAELLRVSQNLKAGASADVSFEEMVSRAEMKRDITRIWTTDVIFVESWHILTLAYLLTRGVARSKIQAYIDYVQSKNELYSIHCIFLKSDPFKILERSRKLHSEKDIEQYYGFYQRLEINIQYILDELGFEYREFNTMKSLSKTVEEVVEYINTFI